MQPDMPPRGPLWANPVNTEHGPGIEIGCDCGTAYILVIDGADRITGPREIATTCDGCHSVRWITVGPVDQLERIAVTGGMDTIGWFIATLHQVIGHDKTAAYLQVPAGDKRACLICQHEARPTNASRAAVYAALGRPREDEGPDGSGWPDRGAVENGL